MYLFACLLVGALAIPGAAASSHVYGPEDSGSEINILVGDTIVITLPENPTTGFMWNFSIPEGLLLLDDRFIPPDRVLPGAGGSDPSLSGQISRGLIRSGECITGPGSNPTLMTWSTCWS